LQNGQKMLKQKLHLCIGVKEQIQIKQYCQSMFRLAINPIVPIKLSNVTINDADYQL